mgnify:CR=1 FL=1
MYKRQRESVRRTHCALKAPITTPVGTGFRSINVFLRQELGLFACIRPCKQYPGVRSFYSHVPVDLVIVRENTEDLYAGVEFEAGKPETSELIDFINKISPKAKIKTKGDETGVSIKPISVSGTERISDLADCDLVIESVVEDLATKRALFLELDHAVKAGAILATNTSTLPVVEMAVETGRPDRVCGIHFFNPAPMMSLVEVVRQVD